MVVLKILLAAYYWLIVVPVGTVKRMSGWDPLQLRGWKCGDTSVFKVDNKTYVASDFEKMD